MGLNPRLELRQNQRLSLTQVQRIRLSVLRLSALDLDEEIARQAAANPFLVFDRPATPASSADPVADTLSAPDPGFQESLRRQITAMDLPAPVAALALFLVGELREDGYLDTELDVLCDEQDVPLTLMAEALRVVQACDPPGVGARSLAECLALQLVDRGLDLAEATATIALLPAFARRDWVSVAAALGIDAAAARDRAALLTGLVSRPVSDPGERQSQILRADLRLERRSDGTLRVAIDDGHRPRLSLDARLVRQAEAGGFGQDLLDSARALIEALRLRSQTIARIGDWLVEAQARFFLDGIEGLAPATRGDLAQALGVHPSTISRAVAGKAIDVDGRLWPLSVFFSVALTGTEGPISARAVQRRIAALVARERPDNPLSDEAIGAELRSQGVDIARRTVAKYRQGLRIPAASQRRRLATARVRE